MARDIERLQGMQNDDGGFPIWRRGDESWPYHSDPRGACAAAGASRRATTCPQEMLDSALGYLRDIETHYPAEYSAGCAAAR